jgi:hypothetical protein
MSQNQTPNCIACQKRVYACFENVVAKEIILRINIIKEKML